MAELRLVLMLHVAICLNIGLLTSAQHRQICSSECETNSQYARLSCEGHMLQCVPDPYGQTHIRHLNMAHNQLTHLKVLAFQSFPRLRILDLRQNAIANIAPGAFSNLNHLQLLDVRANKLRHLYAGMFNGLTAIHKLYLANNEIESIAPGTFTGMTKLISLKLNYNRFNSLHANMFLPLQNLQRLYIYGNQIRTIHDQSFRGLSHLVTLSLAENPLVTIPNILPYVPEITHIRLRNTPLNCDCRLEFFRVWLRENLYEAYESYAICSTPDHLEGTPLYQVPGPLQCPSSRDGNVPISREVNEPSHGPDLEEESASHASAPIRVHSESESEYSEIFASFSDLSHIPLSKPSVTSTEGGMSHRGAGIDSGRSESGPFFATPRIHAHVEPLTPRGTLLPRTVATITTHLGENNGTTDGISHFTPPTLTQSSQKDIPNGHMPDNPRVNATNNGSRVNGSFNELPRPPPKAGNRNHPSWNDGDPPNNPDDSVLTTASSGSTDSSVASSTSEAPQGPPQSWGLKGSSVKIDCPVHIHDINGSKVKWLTPHGKLIMSNVSRYGLTKRGALIIHNLQPYDHGTYRCIVRKALNSVKMLPAKLVLACPCHEAPKQPSFEPSINTTSGNHFEHGVDPHDEHSHPHEPRCSPVPMVVAIVTTFQATVALCVITFCLCCSKNLNYSLKEKTCTGVPEPIAVVRTRGKFNTRSRDYAQSGDPTSSSMLSRESDFYEALTDHGFSPRQASSVRSYDTYRESYPSSEYVNFRKPKNYMYMVGYMDTGTGRRAIGYRSSSDSQIASIKEISNENIYVSKD